MNQDQQEQKAPLWASNLVRILDDFVKIPGTNQGVGLDALLGVLLPGVGDTLTALSSITLILLAVRKKVPTVILIRMVMNIGIDALIGMVPIVGDIFDIFFRSNQKNLQLLEQATTGEHPPSAKDYAIAGLGIGLGVMSVVIPIVVGSLLIIQLVNLIFD